MERHYPSIDNDWFVMGESDSVEPKHIIKGMVLGITQARLELDYMRQLAWGKIERMEYDDKLKLIQIHVGEIQLFPPSTKKTLWPFPAEKVH